MHPTLRGTAAGVSKKSRRAADPTMLLDGAELAISAWTLRRRDRPSAGTQRAICRPDGSVAAAGELGSSRLLWQTISVPRSNPSPEAAETAY